MKKVISLLIAVLLMACAVVSVSAEISPTAPIEDNYIIIDAVAVPDNAGSVTPNVDNPVKYHINEDGTVTLIASSADGFEFTNWEFITGEFDIVEGSLTTSTIVILPTGPVNIKAEAHFEPIASEPTTSEPTASEPTETEPTTTEPVSKPIHKPDDNTQSPTTGQTGVCCASAAVILMIAYTVLVLKKKAC